MKMMEKLCRLLLSLSLCAAILGPAASAEQGFNAGLTVIREDTKITVTVKDSTVLASQKPTLTIPCDFEKAYITHKGKTVDSVLEGGSISFTVASGGDYVIIAGEAPPPAPQPTPAPVTTPAPRPTTDADGNTSIELKTTASGGKLSAAVNASTANRLVNRAVSSESKRVTVEVQPSRNKQVKEAMAELPTSAVARLAEETNAALIVKTPVGSVTIPNEALTGLSDGAGKIAVTAAAQTDEKTGTTVYEIAVLKDGKAVDTVPGLRASLPVPESKVQAGSALVAVLMDTEGGETILPKAVLTEDGKVVLALDVGFATVKLVENTVTYADEIPAWAEDAVQFTSSRKLFLGVGGGLFAADAPMDRAMLVAVLHRLESDPEAGYLSFADVSTDSWYAQAVAWAAESGLVIGTGAGFIPEQAITRQDLALILYRYVDIFGYGKGAVCDFSAMGGAADVAEYAREAMGWAVGSGIIIGDESGALNPTKPTTRGEVSVVLARFVELLVNK